jgi:hypothetical protein
MANRAISEYQRFVAETDDLIRTGGRRTGRL